MAKSITELLNYRTKFEEITTDFNMSGHEGSDINTLEWFDTEGFRANSLRNGYNDALVYAQMILTEYWNGKQKINDCNS